MKSRNVEVTRKFAASRLRRFRLRHSSFILPPHPSLPVSLKPSLRKIPSAAALSCVAPGPRRAGCPGGGTGGRPRSAGTGQAAAAVRLVDRKLDQARRPAHAGGAAGLHAAEGGGGHGGPPPRGTRSKRRQVELAQRCRPPTRSAWARRPSPRPSSAGGSASAGGRPAPRTRSGPAARSPSARPPDSRGRQRRRRATASESSTPGNSLPP